MPRRPRKGVAPVSAAPNVIDLPQPPAPPGPQPPHTDKADEISGPLYFWNTWSDGHRKVTRFPVDLRKFAGVPLIEDAAPLLFRKRFEGMSPASCQGRRKELNNIVSFIRWYEETFGRTIHSVRDVDTHAINQFLLWTASMNTAEATKAGFMQGMNRFLEEMGAPGHLRVAQPFQTGSAPGEADTLSDHEIKALLNQCKREVVVLRRRVREAHRLAARGHDPRREHGGAFRDWQKMECRAWVIKRLLRRELHNFDKMRFEMGLGTVLRGLEGKPGAEVFRADGKVERQGGWNGHIRWFFPWPDDIVPFVVLLMIRTGWNLTTVAALRTRAWCEPIPFSIAPDGRTTHVNIVSVKARGRQDTGQQASVIKTPSPIKPSFHPYKLLKFVDYWTAALRKEVRRKIHELRTADQLSRAEHQELSRLEAIQDDLFIFKTEQQITSLSREDSIKRVLEAICKRAGVDFVTRDLRDAPLLFSYQASGQNLFVVQMLANHADPNTTAQYLRRKRTLQNIWGQFRAVFSASLELAEQGQLNPASLREKLKAQGFSKGQIRNLLDPDSTSRWGNRCADPTNPPEGFDQGHRPGEACASQDCIDGCPSARWFSDSIRHVANNLVVAERRRNKVGLDASLASTLDDRIERCRMLLGRWPKPEADEAVRVASKTIPDDADGILGVALGVA